MGRTLIFLMCCSFTSIMGQTIKNEYSKPNNPKIVVLSFGLDEANYSKLKNWSRQNGVNLKLEPTYNFGAKVLLPVSKRIMMGGKIGTEFSRNPQLENLSFSIAAGRVTRVKEFVIIPNLEVGWTSCIIDFKNPPAELKQLDPKGGLLSNGSLLIKPNIFFTRDLNPLCLGFEFGVKIYTLSSSWEYYGNSTTNEHHVRVNDVPHAPQYNLYFSILIGMDASPR